ncbi:hypothetical protein Tco_0530913 [Tanacetum coccineum]
MSASSLQDEIPPPPPPPPSSQTPTQQTPHEYDEVLLVFSETKATFCGLEDDAVEPFISLSKTLRLLYKSSKLRLSTPGLVLIIKETCDHAEGHFARECIIKRNQDNRRKDAWNSGTKDGIRTGKKEDSKALVTIDGEGVDWTSHSEEDEDYALMACNSSESDIEVTSYSNKCKESYANLKKLYDAQREQLSDASIEIKAYTQGLKKVEVQLVAHQQGQLWYEQKIKIMKIDLDDKTDVLTYHKKLLAEAHVGNTKSVGHFQVVTVNTARASGTKNVSTARHSFNRQPVLTSAAMKVNTVKPIVNRVRPTTVFHKTHSPSSRPFNKTTTLRTNFSKQTVNTAKVKQLVLLGEKGKLLLSPQQVVIGDHKDTSGIMSPNTMVDPVLEIVSLSKIH